MIMTSQSETQIRQLSATDNLAMNSLLTVFAEAFDDEESYNSRRPSSDYLQSLLGSRNFIALVAEKSDEVVGGIAAYVLQKFEQERSEIYLYDLAVSQHHRRQGIAELMISELLSIAVERGISVIFVQADEGDEPAIALYSKFANKEEIAHFDIEVDCTAK